MNSLGPNKTFEEARRQHLIDATIEALADVGFKAASLSQIARRADVSTGLFAHYFGDKDALLEATLRFMAARLMRATRQRLRAATNPRERLDAVPESALADQEFERRTSAVWLAFWGQITHSIRYQRIQRIYQQRMLSNLRHDLRDLVPAPCVDQYAILIASMIDGVWIRSHASATQADGAQARAIVRALIDGLIAGASDASPLPAQPCSAPPPVRIAAPSSVARRIEIVSPVTGEKLGSFIAARHREVDDVVTKARHGLDSWHRMSGYAREKALRRCADLLRLEGPRLARIESLGNGRAIAQTLGTSVPRAAQTFERMSAFASRPTDVRVALGAGTFGDVRHEPLGIVAGFGHWGSPLLGASRQAAGALASGNAMIFQPSVQGRPVVLHLLEIMARSGVPDDVFAVVDGDAQTARLLRSHPDLARSTSPDDTDESLGAPMPKAATIVFADADMELAARAVLQGSRRWTSSPDFSETLIFVEQSGAAAFRSRLLAQAASLRLGDPLGQETQIGALVSTAHLRQVLAWIANAVDSGATLLTGGQAGREGSSALEPTVLDACTDAMPIVCHHAFAPVVTMLAFASDDDLAARIAKRDPATAVGLFCADIKRGREVADRLRRTFCCINDYALSADAEGCSFDSLDEAMLAGNYSRSRRIFCQDQGDGGI